MAFDRTMNFARVASDIDNETVSIIQGDNSIVINVDQVDLLCEWLCRARKEVWEAHKEF